MQFIRKLAGKKNLDGTLINVASKYELGSFSCHNSCCKPHLSGCKRIKILLKQRCFCIGLTSVTGRIAITAGVQSYYLSIALMIIELLYKVGINS